MSKTTIKPLNLKPKAPKVNKPTAPVFDEYVELNELEVPKKVVEYLTNQDLAYRWINATKFKNSGGYHKNHWTPIKMDYDKIGIGDVHFGVDPQGYFRRGDMVLAVRPKQLHEAHKRKLQMRAAQLKASASKQGQEEMKQLVRELGDGSKVFSGYEEDEQ